MYKSLFIPRGVLHESLFLLYHSNEGFIGLFHACLRSLLKVSVEGPFSDLFYFVGVSCTGLLSYCIIPMRGS